MGQWRHWSWVTMKYMLMMKDQKERKKVTTTRRRKQLREGQTFRFEGLLAAHTGRAKLSHSLGATLRRFRLQFCGSYCTDALGLALSSTSTGPLPLENLADQASCSLRMKARSNKALVPSFYQLIKSSKVKLKNKLKKKKKKKISLNSSEAPSRSTRSKEM